MALEEPSVLPTPAIRPEPLEQPSTNGAHGTRRSRREARDAARVTGLRRLTRRERKAMGRLRARRVSRIVRHVDPWAVLKISLLFYACLFLALMVSGVVLWGIASATGTIHSVEGFVKEAFAFKAFSFDAVKILWASILGGLVLVIAGSGLNVVLCVLFNLISDVVGGIRVEVIEEETARPVP